MHSRTEVRAHFAGAMAVLLTVLLLAGSSSMESAPAPAEQPGQAEIDRALEAVKADPNLATLRTIKMLRWRESSTPAPTGPPAWLMWIVGLFRWFDQSARLLVWGFAALLAGFLVAYIAGVVRRYRDARPGIETSVAPSHVYDVDIRPESLPDDIGAAARQLWDRGEHRAALALLYRGMLSRFAHVHHIPIRDSSTEGDCITLATQHLSPVKSDYASRLVGEWQRAVYGRKDVEVTTVYSLCDGFAPALDDASPIDRLEHGTAT